MQIAKKRDKNKKNRLQHSSTWETIDNRADPKYHQPRVAHVESHVLCLTKVIEPQHYLVYTYNKYIYLCIDLPPGSLYRHRRRSAPRGFAWSSAAGAPFDRRVRARASLLARRRVPPPGGIFARGYPRRRRGPR